MSSFMVLILLIHNVGVDFPFSLGYTHITQGNWGSASLTSSRNFSFSLTPMLVMGNGNVYVGAGTELRLGRDSVCIDGVHDFSMNSLGIYGVGKLDLFLGGNFALGVSGFIGNERYEIAGSQPVFTPSYGYKVYLWKQSLMPIFSPWRFHIGYFYQDVDHAKIVKKGLFANLEMFLIFNTESDPASHIQVQTVSESYDPFQISRSRIAKSYMDYRNDRLIVKYWNGKTFAWPHNKIAVIAVGINAYKPGPGVHPLHWCVNDAKAFVDSLASFPGYTDIIIDTLLVRYSPYELNRSRLLRAIDNMGRRIDTSYTLIFYYSGHGLVYNQQFYFAMPRVVDGELLSADTLFKHLLATGAKKILVLMDACHSGAFNWPNQAGQIQTTDWETYHNEVRNSLNQQFKNIRVERAHYDKNISVSVIGAASPDEVAKELPRYEHGIFTYALLRCLSRGKERLLNGMDITNNYLQDCMNREMPQYAGEAAKYVARNRNISIEKAEYNVSKEPFTAVEKGKPVKIFKGRIEIKR